MIVDRTRTSPKMINVEEYRTYLRNSTLFEHEEVVQDLFEKFYKATIEETKDIIRGLSLTPLEKHHAKVALEREELSAQEFATTTGRTLKDVLFGKTTN